MLGNRGDIASVCLNRHGKRVMSTAATAAAIALFAVVASAGCRTPATKQGRSRTISETGVLGGSGEKAEMRVGVDVARLTGVSRAAKRGIIYIGADGNLWSLDTETSRRSPLLPASRSGGFVVRRFWVSPGGKSVAVELVAQTIGGAARKRVPRGPNVIIVSAFGGDLLWKAEMGDLKADVPDQAGWSSDGRRFAFIMPAMAGKERRLTVVDAARGAAKGLASMPEVSLRLYREPSEMGWAGPARLLIKVPKAVRTRYGSGFRLVWRYVDMKGRTTSAPADADVDRAFYGPRTLSLVRRHGGRELFMMGGFTRASPAWSPDGRRLAFLRERQVTQKVPTRGGTATASGVMQDLWAVDVGLGRASVVDAGRVSVLERASWGVRVDQLAWAPDGASIFYWKEVQRATSRKAALRRRMAMASTDQERERIDSEMGTLPFADDAAWLYLISVRPDGTGRKVWFRQLGDWEMARSLAAR